jgi:hypothetical protein
MLTWFLTNLETILKAITGFTVLVIGLVWRKNLIEKGYDKAQEEITEANLEAVKVAKETEKAIKQLSDADLDDKLNKRMRSKLPK